MRCKTVNIPCSLQNARLSAYFLSPPLSPPHNGRRTSPGPRAYPRLRRHEVTSLSFFGQMYNVVQPDKDQFIVKEIKWYKERGRKRHEFLIAQLQRIQGMCVQFAVVERGPSTSANIKQVSKTTIPHTSSLVLAEDMILFLERDAKEALLTQRGADLLITHDFHALPLLEISCIVWMVSKHKECYVITDSMCYWYAFMVVEVAKTYYSSTPINPNSTCSICHMLSGLHVLLSQNVPPEVPPNTDVISDLPPRAGYYRWVNMSKTWM